MIDAIVHRGGWKPWNWSTRTWLVAICLIMVTSPFATRWVCLWQVPDATLPFDFNAFVGTKIPSEQDAFSKFDLCESKLKTRMTPWLIEAANDAVRSHEARWDERLDQWLIDNSDLLAEIKAATEMEQAQGLYLKDLHFDTAVPVHAELRRLGEMLAVEALRCERASDLETAWIWHRAGVRLAMQAEQPGFAIANGIGRAIYTNSCYAISRWASHPALNAQQIRSARTEFSSVVTRRLRLSDIAKVEYCMLENTMMQPAAIKLLFPKWQGIKGYESQFLLVKRMLLWSSGQPEVVLRLSRQLLINELSQMDKLVHLRQKALREEYPMIFELDPEIPRQPGQLTAQPLVRTVESPVMHTLFELNLYFGMGRRSMNVDEAYRLGESKLKMIDVVLAAHEFQRNKGEFPRSIEQLVPEYLSEVPFDPMSKSGAAFRYLRDEDGSAKIWSVGLNGEDDGGDIDEKEPKDRGYHIDLTPPANNPASANPTN